MAGSSTSIGTAMLTVVSRSVRPCGRPVARPPASAGSDTARPGRTAVASAATNATCCVVVGTTGTVPGCRPGASPPPTTPPGPTPPVAPARADPATDPPDRVRQSPRAPGRVIVHPPTRTHLSRQRPRPRFGLGPGLGLGFTVIGKLPNPMPLHRPPIVITGQPPTLDLVKHVTIPSNTAPSRCHELRRRDVERECAAGPTRHHPLVELGQCVRLREQTESMSQTAQSRGTGSPLAFQ